jgi:hypothetical protein
VGRAALFASSLLAIPALGATSAAVSGGLPAGASVTRASEVGASEIVDRVVAVVDGQVITQSELDFEARVALIERGGASAITASLDAAALRSALQWAIAQRLEAEEADRLHAFTVEDSELVDRLRKFEAEFQNHEEYERFLAAEEVDEPQLAEVLARSIRAEKVLDSKVRLKARVTEEEVRTYFQAHPDHFPEGYEKARPAIRERLTRARYQDLVRQELTMQRAGSSVRLVAPFAREPGL